MIYLIIAHSFRPSYQLVEFTPEYRTTLFSSNIKTLFNEQLETRNPTPKNIDQRIEDLNTYHHGRKKFTYISAPTKEDFLVSHPELFI